MSKLPTVTIVALFIAFTVHTRAETITVSLPELTGTINRYENINIADVDLGLTFSEIHSVKVNATGTMTPGLGCGDGVERPVLPYYEVPAVIEIFIHHPEIGSCITLINHFDGFFQIEQHLECTHNADWRILLDGRVDVYAHVTSDLASIGGVTTEFPTAYISEITLTIEGILTTDPPVIPVLTDNFDDNSKDKLWQYFSQDNSVWLNENNRQLQFTTSGDNDNEFMARYISKDWFLDTSMDFTAQIDVHFDADFISEAGASIGLLIAPKQNEPTDKYLELGIGSVSDKPYNWRQYHWFEVNETGSKIDYDYMEYRYSPNETLYMSYHTDTDTLYLSFYDYKPENAVWTIEDLIQHQWNASQLYIGFGGKSNSFTLTTGNAHLDNFVLSSGNLIIPNKNDFNSDGTNDLLWSNNANYAYFVSLIEDAEPLPFQYIGGAADPDIEIIPLSGDYKGNGKTDLIWYRNSNNAYFTTNINAANDFIYIGGASDPDIAIVTAGDFNGDETTDLLWARDSNHAYFITLMNNSHPSQYQYIGAAGNPDIEIIATGNFDDNKTTDLLWKRISNNAHFITLIDNAYPGSFRYVGGASDHDLSLIKVADFDGNATSDFLWRRISNNAHFITLINNATPGSFSYLSAGDDHDITFAHTGDFDGNGTEDILWKRISSNAHFITLMNGSTPGPFKYAGGGGDHDITVIQTGDYNHDGTTDLLWKRTSNNAHFITLINNSVPGPFKYTGAADNPDLTLINLTNSLF